MSPVSLALNRTSNGVRTASASRRSSPSAAPTTGVRRRRWSRVASRFPGRRPPTRVPIAAGSASASGARASGAVRRRKGARKSRARRLMARCSRDWCELAWLENLPTGKRKSRRKRSPEGVHSRRLTRGRTSRRAGLFLRLVFRSFGCLVSTSEISPRPRGRLRFTRHPIGTHGLRGEATRPGHFVTPGIQIRCRPRFRLPWNPCQTFR